MSPPGINVTPITERQMTEIVQRSVNKTLPGSALLLAGSQFEVTTPFTGQLFRVTVEEMPT
jgi:hypothetical protein